MDHVGLASGENNSSESKISGPEIKDPNRESLHVGRNIIMNHDSPQKDIALKSGENNSAKTIIFRSETKDLKEENVHSPNGNIIRNHDFPQRGIGLKSGENNPLETKLSTSDIQEPDEDNLDDLDDLLDDFTATGLNNGADNHPVIQQDGIPAQNQDQEPSDMESTEFRVQLEEQMAALMGGSDETPEMKREIEAALQELGSQLDSGESGWGGKDAKVSNPPSTEKPFQEKIRRTIERMQVSEEQGASASVSDDPDNIIAQLLQEIQGGSFEGGGNEEEFSNMLTNMMEQLTNRDILFEPMKELHEKFPTWMTQNKHRTNEHDLRRYEDQQRLVGEIVGKFNEKEYSDTNPADREYIVERMQQMQAAGSPPPDLVGDMNAAQETLEDFDAGCAQQ